VGAVGADGFSSSSCCGFGPSSGLDFFASIFSCGFGCSCCCRHPWAISTLPASGEGFADYASPLAISPLSVLLAVLALPALTRTIGFQRHIFVVPSNTVANWSP
jgi:hypothetical protein